MSFIKNLQRAPAGTRKSIALGIAALVTILIGAAWFSFLYRGAGGQEASAGAAAKSPFELFSEEIRGVVRKAKREFGDLKNAARRLPY